jgi:hypothetical protein
LGDLSIYVDGLSGKFPFIGRVIGGMDVMKRVLREMTGLKLGTNWPLLTIQRARIRGELSGSSGP